MVERRLDEDDPNWGLANHGRVFDPKRRSKIKVNEVKPDGIDDVSRAEALARHRADMRAVFVRLGRPIPPRFVETEERPDSWRDDWTDFNHMWFALNVPAAGSQLRRNGHRSGVKWA